jgi:hypothetical protein
MSFKSIHKTLKQKPYINFPLKNALFVCVFMNEDYLKLLYLWLESVLLYGNLNTNTDIIIYTSTDFANKIKKTELFSNDTFIGVLEAIKDGSRICTLPA